MYREYTRDRVKILHSGALTTDQIFGYCDKVKPRLVIIDIADKIRIANEDKQLQKKLKRRREKAPPNKLDEIMKECNRLGITYSEYKKKQLLDKVGRVEVVE